MKRTSKALLWCLTIFAFLLAAASVNAKQEPDRNSTLRASPLAAMPADSIFEIHFIDVGQADAMLVLCDGEAMLVDGGNAEDSNLIYSYLKQRSLTHLEYLVATHAHEDHVGGLSGALNYASAGMVYCPVTSYNSRAFDSFLLYLAKQGKQITIPNAGDYFMLGSAVVRILGPLQEAEDPNNMSIVLHITYGRTTFLLAGDAEREEELDMLEADCNLRADVLKIGHHGSNTSTTYPFLRAVNPEYAVITVGNGNTYGHPTEETLSKLRDADVKVYRTDLQGDIICISDGENIRFYPQRP